MGTAQSQNYDQEALVSVIIPAYRNGTALRWAAESVLAQTYCPLELIVCDDGTEGFSADAFQAELGEYAPDIRCVVVHHAENLGTVKNLSAGLELAAGAWVLFLAADDILVHEDVIACLVNQAKVQRAEWIVPKTAVDTVNGGLEPGPQISALMETGDVERLFEALCFHCCLPASGGFYRRETLQEVGGLDLRFRLVEDWPLFLHLVRQGILPKESTTMVVRRGKGGVSRNGAGKNRTYQSDLIRVLKEIIEPAQDRLPDEVQKKLKRWIRDKEAVFQLRFSCPSNIEKLRWMLTHFGVIVRKIVRRGPGI